MQKSNNKLVEPAEALEDLKKLGCLFLTAEQAAPVVGCDAASLRLAAQTQPAALGFPVCVMGSRVRIPRGPFIRFWEG